MNRVGNDEETVYCGKMLDLGEDMLSEDLCFHLGLKVTLGWVLPFLSLSFPVCEMMRLDAVILRCDIFLMTLHDVVHCHRTA